MKKTKEELLREINEYDYTPIELCIPFSDTPEITILGKYVIDEQNCGKIINAVPHYCQKHWDEMREKWGPLQKLRGEYYEL